MSLNNKELFPSPPEITLIQGQRAVEAYWCGVRDALALEDLGHLQRLKFSTLREVNAFIFGVEMGSQAPSLAVDDVKHE